MPVALISGVSGQDGSYLAEYLVGLGYDVHGIVRRGSTPKLQRLYNVLNHDRFTLHQADLMDQASIFRLIRTLRPDEVYNLAAQSFVAASWDQPIATAEFTAVGVLKMLEAIRDADHPVRFYQASSSEMFGRVVETPQKETTPFYPRSPYGVSKCFGHWMTVNYRESFGLYAVSGILFNHESSRRGLEFVTRKISHAVANIKLGKQKKLKLGNIQSKRDWGDAAKFVQCMHLMLQQKTPGDYVIATGETHTVEEFVQIAFDHVGLDWHDFVEFDQSLVRPAEVDLLLGDSSKAKRELGWKYDVKFEDLVKRMVDCDIEFVKTGDPKLAMP